MDTLAWLAQLISFDTTSHQSNLALIDCIEAWFKQYNLPMRRTCHAAQPKANLLATLPAKNGSMQGGILFSGHTDVVPVTGQSWATNPFEAIQKDNKIFGRGACDMKGFLAVMLACVPALSRLQLPFPLHFAFSYDEEIGCVGVPLLIADMLAAGIQPDACIVGEPTSMQPVIAHKGIQGFHCQFHGKAAHSSLTSQGCNAVDYAARLICYIRDMADTFRESGPFDPYFDVAFTTLSTNQISGGTALNIIPADCDFIFEFRNLPGINPDVIIEQIQHFAKRTLLPAMQKEYVDARIDIGQTGAAPGFEISPDTKIFKIVSELTQDKDIHKVGYATEAGLFQKAGIPTVICGPGSIRQAHGENEFVTVEQLKKCEQFMIDIAKSWHHSGKG